MEQIIIIGTGCAGLTAGIYASRAGLAPLLLDGMLPGGLLTTTSEVENFPGFPEGINGFELTNRMRQQAERFGARFVADTIHGVEKTDLGYKVTAETNTFWTKALIIATGAGHRMLNIPGEKEMFGGRGVSVCATCDGAFYRGMDVVVVGGGDSACEEALFLTRFASRVFLIHRRDQLRASPIMAKRVLAHAQISPIWNAKVEAILPDDAQMVRGVRVNVAGASQEIPCKGVFLAIGHQPNTQLFSGLLPLDSEGYVQTSPHGSVCTALAGLFVAGDCVDKHYRQAITAAGLGCQAAIEAERWLAKQDTR